MTMIAPATVLQQFHWEPQPETQRFIDGVVAQFLSRCAVARDLAERMSHETGTRFYDWIDYILVPADVVGNAPLEPLGFAVVESIGQAKTYENTLGVFPKLVVAFDGNQAIEVALKVESVVDFLAANDLSSPPIGQPLCDVRFSAVCECRGAALYVVERHGNRRCARQDAAPSHALKRLQHLEQFRIRRRRFDDDADGFVHANALIDAAVTDLGRDLTCDLFFAAEREYWQKRNHAARIQKARQDRLGLGWANHDHHTYRSSRRYFTRLVATWEKLGFVCRERFYAGREAGWGAQVMEQPVCGLITFNDVDLTPDELFNDFAHEPLAEQEHLRTVGLWCGLHGDSFLQSGMHHLEAQFDFAALREQLAASAVKTMNPFTNFAFLKQAFTEGERWPVEATRIDALLAANLINSSQAEKFRLEGAIGSHLENLERNDGFKGFNQEGVSEIINATDPRRQQVGHLTKW